ncbi:hypothetical protein Btru_038050 [Bulinus truncatus]|nr:hypothetical protein Btru_038050 [Bulinus truncatus]
MQMDLDTDLSLILWLMSVLATICPMPHVVHSTTVQTSKGHVRGMTKLVNGKKVDIFYGIPYAKPPIGNLRFSYPEPPDAWSDVKNATQPPNCCMQIPDTTFSNFSGSDIWNPNRPQGILDCQWGNQQGILDYQGVTSKGSWTINRVTSKGSWTINGVTSKGSWTINGVTSKGSWAINEVTSKGSWTIRRPRENMGAPQNGFDVEETRLEIVQELIDRWKEYDLGGLSTIYFIDQVSEDCLYLNVWTPRTNPPFSNKAVMVWIYGGSFSSGSSTLDIYDGQILAAEYDVVVVSMQYRFGALGFFMLGSNDAPGNAGMMDIVLALQWIQTNIHFFGGNAHNVTLMGESSGAVGNCSIGPSCKVAPLRFTGVRTAWMKGREGHCYSPRSSTATPKPVTRTSSSACGGSLPSLFPQNEYNTTKGIGQFPFLPAIDGRFLRMSPSEYLKEGSFKKAPILLGSNANEGTWLLVYFEQQYFDIKTDSLINRRQYDEVMNSIFNYYPQYPTELSPLAKDAIKVKYTDWIDPEDQVRLRGQVEKAVGDHMFTCSAAAFAKAMSKAGQDVYFYRFSHRIVNHDWPDWMGVLHGDEIFFVFGLPVKNRNKYTKEEEKLSRKMMKFWTNFAKTGNPNRGPGELEMREWPKFKHNEQLYLNISTDMLDSSSSWGQGVRSEYCGFLENYIPLLSKSGETYQ